MGADPRCYIAYGFVVNKEDLPWRNDDYDYDEETWWRKKQDYEPPFELFDEKGNWLPDMEANKQKRDEYYEHRRAWDETNPMPFGVITGNEGEECAIVCVPGADCLYFDWDEIGELDPKDLSISDEQKLETRKLRHFLGELGIEIVRGPAWHVMCNIL